MDMVMSSKNLEYRAERAKERAEIWLRIAMAFDEGRAPTKELDLAIIGYSAAMLDWEEALHELQALKESECQN